VNSIRIGREFRVSSLAILFRARNTEIITESELQNVRAQFQADFERRPEVKKGGGGDPYNNKGIELGKGFIRRVVARTLEGRTLYSEAFELLGTRNSEVVHTLAQRFL
jgi:Zn-dependent peptidase ImmA (M78 family)